MDQYGRPEMSDWTSLAGAVRGMRKGAIEEQAAQENLDYQRQLRPLVLASQDESLRRSKMEYDMKADMQRREAGAREAVAVSTLMDAGDGEAAGRLAASWYDKYIPDGHTGEFQGLTEDGRFRFIVDDGSGKRTERVLARGDIEGGMQAWAAKDPLEFLAARKKEKLDIHNFNLTALQKPQVLLNDKGAVVLGVLAKDATGRASLNYTDTYGRRLDGEAVAAGGYQPLGVMNELDERRTKKLTQALAQLHFDAAKDDPKQALAKIESEAFGLQEAMFQRAQEIERTEDPLKRKNLEAVQAQAAERLGFLEDQMEKGTGPSERALTAVTSAARAEWKNMSTAERAEKGVDEEAYINARIPALLDQWNTLKRGGRLSAKLAPQAGGGKTPAPEAVTVDKEWKKHVPPQAGAAYGANGSW